MGLQYWSLSAWAKHKVKNAVSVIGRFEEALTLAARETGVDGVICGHIHYADSHERSGVHYVNTGDWVESCTAVVETAEGALELVRWTAAAAEVPRQRRFRLRRRAGSPT
jgi:UDP-2,3-diacylglucosamine pyrophosphatase LpxH